MQKSWSWISRTLTPVMTVLAKATRNLTDRKRVDVVEGSYSRQLVKYGAEPRIIVLARASSNLATRQSAESVRVESLVCVCRQADKRVQV
jgi:hypothetical protein